MEICNQQNLSFIQLHAEVFNLPCILINVWSLADWNKNKCWINITIKTEVALQYSFFFKNLNKDEKMQSKCNYP